MSVIRSVRSRVRPSNTDPSNYNAAVLVATGVDTLVVSVKCKPLDSMLSMLRSIRDGELASAELSSREPLPIPCGVIFADSELSVLPHGRKSWSVVLRNELVDVQLGRGGVAGVYALIRCSAAFLWSRSLAEVIASLNEFVAFYWDAGAVESIQVSECHLARDVAGVDLNEVWSDLRPGLITRADRLMPVENHARLESVMIGSRSSRISAILYDKSREIQKSHKLWMREVWSRNGWQEDMPVWRAEFRMRRDFLRAVKIETLDDLAEAIGTLWAYVAGEWFRHSEDTDPNVTRRQVSLWWSIYCQSWDGCDNAPCAVEDTRCENAAALVRQAAGCLLSAGALFGMVASNEVAALVLPRFDEVMAQLGSVTFDEVMARRRRRFTMSA